MRIASRHTDDHTVVDHGRLLSEVGQVELSSTVIVLCNYEVIEDNVTSLLGQNSIFKIFVYSEVGEY
jgi:hypothetical protein